MYCRVHPGRYQIRAFGDHGFTAPCPDTNPRDSIRCYRFTWPVPRPLASLAKEEFEKARGGGRRHNTNVRLLCFYRFRDGLPDQAAASEAASICLITSLTVTMFSATSSGISTSNSSSIAMINSTLSRE